MTQHQIRHAKLYCLGDMEREHQIMLRYLQQDIESPDSPSYISQIYVRQVLDTHWQLFLQRRQKNPPCR